ncbi:MAG: hypothetical protein A2075_18940 [Geobacteraceae bacterium GWC2_58_44]|nr:MAG: hypothetical protein A2075_18940 [Geobacteraceae bacterium GWC2_58_44]HBG07885.1 hypothetical protein [Geobacter sp.]
MSKKLILNSCSGVLCFIINIAVAFIMSPVILKVLGNRDYGLWELVMSVIGYMGLLDLGIGPALVRFVSVANGKEDREDLQKTISTALLFFVAIGGVALLLFAALGYSPQLIAGSDTKNIANVGTVFLLLGLDAGLLFPLQVFVATLMGLQRHYFINGVRAVLSIFRALLTFYLLQRNPGNGLIVLAFLEPIFTLLQFVMFAGAVHFIKEVPRMVLSAVTWGKMKELFTFGVKSATMLVASRLQNQSVPLIIGNVVGLGSVVYFVMPNRLVDYAKGLSQTVGFPLTPYFGATIGKGDQAGVLEAWLNSTLALQIVSLAMPVAIFFCGGAFLSLWIGPEYAVAGQWVLYLLLAGLVADSLASNSFRILTAQSQHGRSAMLWLLFSALSVPIGIWGASRWGVVGVTLGTTFVMVFGNLVTILLACSVMQISVAAYLRKTFLRLALPLLLLISVLWMMEAVSSVTSYFSLFVHLLVGGCVYCLAVWRLTLTGEIRERVRNSLSLRFATQE